MSSKKLVCSDRKNKLRIFDYHSIVVKQGDYLESSTFRVMPLFNIGFSLKLIMEKLF